MYQNNKSASNKIRIRNWKQFQHFKDRKPLWIKLYRDLLDNVDWHELPGDDAKALVERGSSQVRISAHCLISARLRFVCASQ